MTFVVKDNNDKLYLNTGLQSMSLFNSVYT